VSMEDLMAALGIDMNDPVQRLANSLVSEDDNLLEELVSLRISSGITRERVADAIGCTVDDVRRFETVSADPHLSMVRRYALVVGASISHSVKKAF
jgi:DNA-binding XRE family transcriptional regulator